MFKRYYIILSLLSIILLCARANDFNVMRRISSADGLSNDFVTEMTIDGHGYVWVATEAGVSRISGNSCQTFLITDWPPKENFLTLMDSNRLLPGQEDKNMFGVKITALRWHKATDQMFVGTEMGMIVYDCKRGTMRYLWFNEGLISSTIKCIAESKTGLWLVYGNGKIQYMDCKTLKVQNIKVKHEINANCAIDNGDGTLILGNNKMGVSLLDTKTGSVRLLRHKAGDATSLPGDNVRRIIKDSAGRIWVGTDHGMALLNLRNGTFIKVRSDEDNYDGNVYDIKQMHDGTLWVANDMGGIKVIDPGQKPVNGALYYRNDVSVRLSAINTRAIAQDEYGNIWIGNHSTGVDFISAKKPEFSIFNQSIGAWDNSIIYCIAPAKGGGLWLAGERELALWKNGKLQNKWLSSDKAQRKYAFPRCLMSDSKGRVWLGIDDYGAVCFDSSTGVFKTIDIGLPDCDIHSFAEDSDGRIWIGSEYGVYSWKDGEGVRHEKIIANVIDDGKVTTFLWLKKDILFISTHGQGAYVINMKTGKSKSLAMQDGLPSDRISKAVTDGKGGLWLATHEGLVHVDDAMNLKGLKVYNIFNGLADNHTTTVMTDKIGRIWVSTYSGISCLDTKTGRIYNYNHKDTGQPCAFITRPTMDNDGMFYFCTASGVMCFDPLTLTGNQKASQAQIISCEAYSPADNETRIMLLSADEDGVAHTSYHQNTLRITFCVRNYAQSNNVEYSYMMKGMDDKWYYVGDDNDVVFRGLRPGHYTFILRARLKSQDWQDASVTQMEIYIHPPFWQTWWAYTLYALALIGIIIVVVRSYKQRLAQRNSLELERRENLHRQQLNEERLHFFTNVTHELRTPLTLIMGPLEDAIEGVPQPSPLRRRLEMIHKNADRLRNLINEILEFRKTETQNRRLTVAKGDIGQFVSEICLNFKELYKNPKVEFKYYVASNLPKVYFDSEVITTILNNLLSNAIKYTEEGSITTTMSMAGSEIKLTVADTGYGISKEALPHIFDRYYQADGKHQASGTGIGLALVKALADLHEALISVSSTEGQGSTFTLTMDSANTYPNALHKEDIVQPKTATENEDENENDEEIAENQQLSLLVVEDNADIREYIADAFGEEYKILQAENGEEGLRVAVENIPDIIVSDIMMPKMNGIELTKRLKEDIRTSHIPVILLTAKDTDDDKEEGYDSGADSYLTKPFTTKLLASRINNLLTTRRRLAEYLSDNVRQTDSDTVSAPELPEDKLSLLDRKFMTQLDEVISKNLTSGDLNLPFISSQMAMSHSTFYRKVKALTGLTAKEYIRKAQLRHCYEMLKSGDYTVNEAAMLAGFSHMPHFREVFKKEFGILPSEVIKG